MLRKIIEESLQEAVRELLHEEKLTSRRDGEMKIVRCYSSGVFYALVESLEGRRAILRNARRVHYWDGAASLSELAVRGTSKPNECRIPVAVDRIEVLDVIEILDTTSEARASIEGVKEWSAH